MTRPQADQPLVPSVLDRLLDDQPDAREEPSRTRGQVLRELKQSVRRDLENLLNTRWRCMTWPESLEELARSLANYGVPDVTGADLGSNEKRQSFLKPLQTAIGLFEPRLKNVEITVLDNTEPLDRVLRFRIRALLQVEPAPEPVVFDSAVQPITGGVEVKRAG
jgi:type VI secretion system protein ImpF